MPIYSQNDTRPVEIESPRILLAEDDFLTRMLVSDCLREDGFVVLEASNGDEAVDILQSGLSVDLIFTDVHMPGRTDGLELLSFAQSRWPQLPVLLTSGHLLDVSISDIWFRILDPRAFGFPFLCLGRPILAKL